MMRFGTGVAGLAIVALSLSAAAIAQNGDFATAMDGAMARMHVAMTAGYTGDTDRDFATMMIPHHQGAIDMAELELRYGKDERLRRLAQGIIVEQRQEIMVVQGILAVDQAAPPKSAEPHPSGHSDHGVYP